MKENEARTPPPWPEPAREDDTGPSDESIYSCYEIENIAKFENEADAMFAWTAVNSYTALLEAATFARNRLLQDSGDQESIAKLNAAIALAEKDQPSA